MTTDQLAVPTADWVRVRLAKGHPRPGPGLALRPYEWVYDGEPVREWLLDPDPARNDRIESEVQQWAIRLGLYRPGTANVMAEGPCTVLASVVLAGAPDELIRLLSKYWTLIIAFDDQVIEAGHAPQPYLRAVEDILLRGELPAQPDIFHLAFADVHDGIRKLDGEALLPEFTGHVTDAIGTYVREWRCKQDGTVPSIAECLRDAVANTHMLPGMVLQRLRPGLVPPGTPLPADVDHLARLVNVISRLENDLLAYRKDEREGAANICWSVAREYGIEPIRAVPIVVGMIDALRVQLDDLLAAILADPSRAGVHHQARTISDWVDAVYAWYLTVARYELEHRGRSG
jgi:terpene synthase-like protein